MGYYCKECGLLHAETELCPDLLEMLKKDPSLISQAATFSTVAAQYRFVTSQDFQKITNTISKIGGVNIQFEGTHQYIRDIQVFRRLNEEAFCRSGVFQNASAAKEYIINASPNQLNNLSGKLAGYGQEVDWLRQKQGEISSLLRECGLLNKNAPGIDGVTTNQLTGKKISVTTVKAAQTMGGLNTNAQSVIKAIKKGTFPPDGVVFGVEGIKEKVINKLAKEIKHAHSIRDTETVSKLLAAQQRIRFEEFSNPTEVFEHVKRLQGKMQDGQAIIVMSVEGAMEKAFQGAIIGAAVGLPISIISSYIRFKKGNLTKEQAFTEIAEDTTKSTITGAAISGLSLFLPAGFLGFCGGMVFGVYLSSVLTNILDEVFGKGAYREILYASGFVSGASQALMDAIKEIEIGHKKIEQIEQNRQFTQQRIQKNFKEFDKLMEE